MKIIKASAMGMCFGVKDALKIVHDIESPEKVTIYGELVHNEEVIFNLKKRGFQSLSETGRSIPPTSDTVLITAHGISDKEKSKILQAGKRLIDTTCPLVRYVHDSAQRLQKKGYFVIVIGKPGHIAVKGIIGDLENYEVIQSAEEVKSYPVDRIGIVCQSTTPLSDSFHIRREIERKNPGKEIQFINTICRPTKERQLAVMALIEQVDALVVVGGKHSNNTKQLVRLAESHKIPIFHIQTAEDLNPMWFKNFQKVGLTAGTSTLDKTVEEVCQLLRSLDYVTEQIHPAYAAG